MSKLTFVLTADGQTDPEFVGVGDVHVHAIGTFGSGTLTLEEKQPDGLFDPVIDSAKQADTDYIHDAANDDEGGVFRFDLSGATAPTVTITVSGKVRTVRADV